MPNLRCRAAALLASTCLVPIGPAAAQDAARGAIGTISRPSDAGASPRPGTEPPTAEVVLPEVVVQSQRAAAARNAISVRLGASVYEIDGEAIRSLPQGGNAPFNQVLLQAPGVAQDSFGEIHVRGEHRNVQYRLNGVTLPETIGGFGQLLDSRSIRSVSLITGALPAQFGFRQAGIIDVELRSGATEPGGVVGVYGGGRSTIQPFAEYGGTAGGWEYFATGNYLSTDRGIENPTGSLNNPRDASQQTRGLGYAARQLDDNTRLSLITGATFNRFQIPTRPGQMPSFTAYGISDFDSANLREHQWERTLFNVASLQHTFGGSGVGGVESQLSYYSRYNSIRFTPDTIGDLVFNGVAAEVRRSSFVNGLQGDNAWRASPDHTVRFGFQAQRETTRSINRSTVLPLDDAGNPIDSPFLIDDSSQKTGYLYGLYVQDEWRLTDRLTLNYGTRLDHIDQFVHATELSPRANAVWRPTDTTTLHLGYAHNFTPPPQELIAPTSIGRFAGTTQAPEVTQNDRQRAERTNLYDIGASQRLGPVTLGVDAYYKQQRDLLDEGQFGQALVFGPYNYRQGRVAGVEFTASYRTERLLAYGNLAVAREVGRGIVSNQFNFGADELAYISNHFVRTDHDQRLTGSAGVIYAVRDGTRASATLLTGSGLRRGFANTEKTDPYQQVNLGVQQDFNLPDGGRWTARFDVINVFDQRYELRDGTGIGVGAPQYGPRIAFLGGLSRAF